MDCPYCHQPMEPGILNFGRDKPVFSGESDRVSRLDRILGGIGQLTGLDRHWVRNKMQAHFCPRCKKMILQTDLAK